MSKWILLLISVIAVLPVLATSCSHAGISRDEAVVVERALSDHRSDAADDEKVVAMGERAIPAIIDNIRARPNGWARYHGGSLIIGMIQAGKVDRTAAYVRKVLGNPHELESVRVFAAEQLSWYDSPEVMISLIEHSAADQPLSVRMASVQSLCSFVVPKDGNLRRLDSRLQSAISKLIKDRSPSIRLEACSITIDVALSAPVDSPIFGWGWKNLQLCKSDKSKEVRSVAREGLRRLDEMTCRQDKRKAGEGIQMRDGSAKCQSEPARR